MVDYSRIQDRLGRVFDKQVFFITGWTRPGTAWIRRALDAHPDVCCKGEGHFADGLYPLLGRSMELYNRHSRRGTARRRASGIEEATIGFTHGELEFILAQAIGLSLSRWAGDSPVLCIGDKTPEHVMFMDLLARVVPGARFIHVVRDGRDEAVSVWDFNRHVNPEGFAKQHTTFESFVDSFAKTWSDSVAKAHAFGRDNPERFLEIFCEDLMNEPEPVIRDLFRFLRLEEGEKEISLCLEAGAAAAAAAENPGIWRGRFEDNSLAVFRRNAGELLKLLGYDS